MVKYQFTKPFEENYMSTLSSVHACYSSGRIRLDFNIKTLIEELRSCGTGILSE